MSPQQKMLFLGTMLSLLAAGVVWAAAIDDVSKRFHYDFRGKPIPGLIQLAGPEANKFLRAEPEGLRVTLPKDRSNLEQVGFFLHWTLPGDFEAIATFEILNVEIPNFGYGVGLSIGVNDKARVGRLARAGGQQVAFWDYWPTVDGQRQHFFKFHPCDAKRGRLRLRRVDETICFQWSPDEQGDSFFEVHRLEFGKEDTKFFTFMASTGDVPALVDVRLLEFTVGPINVPPNRLKPIAAILGCVSLASAGGLGLTYLIRRKPAPVVRKSVPAPATSTSKPVKPMPPNKPAP